MPVVIQGLGDIWLLAQAGTRVIQKLHAAATTAPQEVKDLIEDAAIFKDCLKRTEISIDRQGAILRPHDDVKAAIVQVFRRCGDILGHLERIASSYESIVERDGEPLEDARGRRQWLEAIDTAYRAYRRVRWTTEDGAIRELQDLLHKHETHLQTVMLSLTVEAMTQILEWQAQTGQIDFIHHTPSSPALRRPPQSESTSSGSQSPAPRPPPSLEPIRLPSPAIDPYDYEFPDTLPDLTLHNDFMENGLPYARWVREDENSRFFSEIVMKRDHVQIPVESVTFVFRLSPTSTAVTITASDAGQVLLLKNTPAEPAVVNDIWTLNEAKTVRVRHKLPIYDEVIPYPFPMNERSASIDQGFALSFVTLEGRDREIHSIPTTWVTYRFWDSTDCHRFQEYLYGWKLLLIVPVKEIYRRRHLQSDERLTGSESIRIWKKESESEVRFMVRLEMKEGRKKYLEFNLCQDVIRVETRGEKKLQFQRVKAVIDEPTSRRRSSTPSISPVSSLRRRFSIDDSPNLEDITIEFRTDEGRDRLHQIALNSRLNMPPPQSVGGPTP